MENMASWGCHLFCFKYTYFVLTLNLIELSHILGPLECYADGHHKCYTENEVCISSAHVYGHCPIWLLLQNTSSKIKLLRILKLQVQNIKPNLFKSVGYRAFVTEQVTHLKRYLLIALMRILIGPGWVRHGSLDISFSPVYGALWPGLAHLSTMEQKTRYCQLSQLAVQGSWISSKDAAIGKQQMLTVALHLSASLSSPAPVLILKHPTLLPQGPFCHS